MEELETLAAIYPELEYDEATLSGSLEIKAAFDAVEVQFDTKHTVRHLPPVLLFFALPEGYPETKPPQFAPQCEWVDEEHTRQLCSDLEELWETLKDESTLFACVEMVRERVDDLFGLPQPLRLPEHLKNTILSHDTYADREKFAGMSFACSICQETRKGAVCTQLSCSHVACTACLQEYYSSCITQGQVELVHCVEVECKEPLEQEQLLEIVGQDSYDRFQKLLVKKRLEKDPNSVDCPRTNCDTLVFRKPGEYMARCSKCRYTFCVNCRKAWHGTYRGCVIDVPPDELLKHYLDADDEEKRDIEVTWGKANVETHLRRLERSEEDDKLFRKAMKEANIVACPQCTVPIEKSDGCNKIKCAFCLAAFCFLCGVSVASNDPYAHWRDEGGECYGRLFEGITEEELQRRGELAMMGVVEDD
ncbi:Translation termination inhibitor protein [Yarrowia sp. B02]|nr:Translation termination inhibitor protein [Yarrowia sp. B02]